MNIHVKTIIKKIRENVYLKELKLNHMFIGIYICKQNKLIILFLTCI